MSSPTGEQHSITAAGYTAVVVEGGGGLRLLEYDAQPLVAGYRADEQPSGGRGQVLMPWPNRIRDGHYRWEDAEQQLPLTEPALHNASHGLVRWVSWHLQEKSADRVRLGCRLVAQPGYPWSLELSVTYALSPDGLEVTMAATNISELAAPFAAGLHPYLFAGTTPVDDCLLTVPAATHLVVDDRLLPTGTESVGAELDFGSPRRIGDLQLDDGFTDLTRDEAGWCVVRLEGAYAVELCLDPSWRCVQLFTGDPLPTGARQALAVEPMTAPADAFNSGTDVTVLAPEQSWQGSFRIRMG